MKQQPPQVDIHPALTPYVMPHGFPNLEAQKNVRESLPRAVMDLDFTCVWSGI